MCWLFDVLLLVAIKSQFLMVQTEEEDAERWREPTRLLLLDEKYLDKPDEELPQSVQVASFFCKLLPSFSSGMSMVMMLSWVQLAILNPHQETFL